MRSKQAYLAASTLMLAFTSLEANAFPYGSFDSRSLGMGGAGVAAGTSANAVLLNPALLASPGNKEKFSLDVSVGARLSDPGDMLDAVNDFNDTSPINGFQSAIEDYMADSSPEHTAAVETSGARLIDQLEDLSDKALQAEGNAALVVGVPGERLGVSAFANAYVVGGTIGLISGDDIAAIQGAIDAAGGGNSLIDPTGNFTSSVQARFATVAETGVAFATRIDILGGIAIGVTPKYVQVKTYDYTFVGAELDNADIDLKEGERSDSNFNFDLGLATAFGADWLVGLSVRNLISKEYRTVENNILKIEPQARVGIAHRSDWLTIAADLDVTENDPAGFENKTRYAIVGAELDLYRTLQLRLGYRHNMSDPPPGQEAGTMSAGLGFSPFGVHIDAAVAGNSDEIGGAVQIGYRF